MRGKNLTPSRRAAYNALLANPNGIQIRSLYETENPHADDRGQAPTRVVDFELEITAGGWWYREFADGEVLHTETSDARDARHSIMDAARWVPFAFDNGVEIAPLPSSMSVA
jgi:hypothetical protein